MSIAVRGLWNIVLSGYPRSGKTMLARRLVSESQSFSRVGVDELREMFFNEVYPCRDEFLVYSMIAEMRDALLERGYSVVIDSTAPDNVTREFLLTTRFEAVNRLVILFNVNRDILIRRNVEKFDNARLVFAWDKRWQKPKPEIPLLKFGSNNMEEFDAYFSRLKELWKAKHTPLNLNSGRRYRL